MTSVLQIRQYRRRDLLEEQCDILESSLDMKDFNTFRSVIYADDEDGIIYCIPPKVKFKPHYESVILCLGGIFEKNHNVFNFSTFCYWTL